MMPLAIMRFAQGHRSLPGCSPPILPGVTFVSSGSASSSFDQSRNTNIFQIYFFTGEAVEKAVSSCFNSGMDSWFYNGSLEVAPSFVLVFIWRRLPRESQSIQDVSGIQRRSRAPKVP
jgi:hypothetical protein